MDREKLLSELRKKEPAESYAGQVYEGLISVTDLLDIMETEWSAVKYMAEKVVSCISEERPRQLYPFFCRLFSLLDCDNAFIRLGVILSVANLLETDSRAERKWDSRRERFLCLFETDEIAVFGNAVHSVPKIFKAYPKDAEKIMPLLLKTDSRIFYRKGEQSPECTNVAVGHVIDCFLILYPLPGYEEEMLVFAERNRDNERKQVRGKINKFLHS